MRSPATVLVLAGAAVVWAITASAEGSPAVGNRAAGSARPAPGSIKVAPGAAAEKVPEKQLITMDFQDVEIGVLVKFVSEITGRNFILDEKVRGKVTVISPTKISIEEAYRVFQSILEVKGFTTLPAGPVTKIVPVRDARESGAPLATKATVGDQFITQLVPLTFIEPSTLAPVLQPMVSKDGLVTAYDPASTIVLIDTASNVQRLISIISELDIEMPERGIEMIRLENAYAQAVAATLQQVLEAEADRKGAAGAAVAKAPRPPGASTLAGATSSGPFRIIADERTNSVIALANPAQMRVIRNLVKDLDKKLEGVSKINVMPLKYANAVEMVQVLSELIGGGGGRGAAGGFGGFGAGGTSSRRTTRQQQQNSFSRNAGGYGGGGRQGGLGASSGAPGGANNPGQGGPVSATGSGGEFVGEVRVTADPYTNSLIVSAGPQDFDVLRRVIVEIDVPRRQVFVEAIILEISLDKSRQLGFDYQGGIGLNGEGVGLGRMNLANLNTALASPQSLSGLVLAAASNQTVTLPNGTKVPAQVALFTALQSDRDVNILSAPTILTSDNQEAEILVGQNIPFIASRATSETNLNNTFATVQRQDVGITLRLTPQISQGDSVRLDLYEEVSAVVPNPQVDVNIAGPTTTVRSASTTIVAKNGQTVALGGLISDNVVNTQSKIPYIGDIPVIGNLFKTTDDRKNKVNLLIFLTPHVVHDENDLRELSVDARDRFKSALRDEKTGPRRREQLDAPSWQSAAPARSSVYTAPQRPYEPSYALPPPTPAPYSRPPPPQAAIERPLTAQPAAPIVPSSPGALGIPTSGHHFAILLTLFEKGNPPPELQATNGFLTVYTPIAAGDFFAKGTTYEYRYANYEARYSCLEVFPDTQSALSVYPEGQPLERWGNAVVRWKPISADQHRAMIAGNSPWKRSP